MNNSEKTQPLLTQEAHEQAVQEKPAYALEDFPTLAEEQLEEVVGTGWLDCCIKPRSSSPARSSSQAETPGPQVPNEPTRLFPYETPFRAANMAHKYVTPGVSMPQNVGEGTPHEETGIIIRKRP